MITGNTIESFITKNIKGNTAGWQLKRNQKRNAAVRVTGILICDSVSNKAVGIAKQKNYNLIITIDPINFTKISGEALEVLYKQDIFVYAIGNYWEFQRGSNEFIAKIFNVDASLIFRETTQSTSFTYSTKQPLYLFLQKFEDGKIIWTTQNEDEQLIPSIQSVALVADETNANKYLHSSINLIISYVIPSLLPYDLKNHQTFLYIQRPALLKKITQILYYLCLSQFNEITVDFYTMKIKLPKNNGRSEI